MTNKKTFFELVDRHWRPLLSLVAAGLLIINIAAFYPGYMSNDSKFQLCQAMRECSITTWHPVAMVVWWRQLIDITHHIAALLVVQLCMLWLALLLLALHSYQHTHSQKLSLSVLVIGLLPNVINISGVIWKDNQMAFSLLLAVVLMLSVRVVHARALRLMVFGIACVLILYASVVRYNAVFCTLPIVWLAVYQSRYGKQLQYYVGASILLFAMSFGTITALNGWTHAMTEHVEVTMIVADITNLATEEDVKAAALPAPLKVSLATFYHCDLSDENRIVGAYFLCGTDRDRVILADYYSSLRHYWLSTVAHHLPQYMLFKVAGFMPMLFPNAAQYVWQDGMTPTYLRVEVKSPSLKIINQYYTLNFGYRNLSFLYESWFWLTISIILLWFARRLMRYRFIVTVICASAILNIASFVPASITSDYRYIYWSVLACMVAMVLLTIERLQQAHAASGRSILL